MSKITFNELPQAYFCDNKKSDELRKQLIRNQALITNCDQSSLEQTFFSDKNIELINKQLILSVWKKTDKKFFIKPQSKESLTIVMRYVFIENAKHLPYNITEQVRELNCNVVGEVLPKIITNLEQKMGYLKDISQFPEPIPLPVSGKGMDKKLPPLSSLFFKF